MLERPCWLSEAATVSCAPFITAVAGVAFGATDLSETELEGANVGLILNGYIPGKR